MENNDKDLANAILELYIAEIHDKLFVEYWPRLYQCLDECDKKLLWYRPNLQSNSIGNLVLHLEGNVRQWVIHRVAGIEDVRKRRTEFEPNEEIRVDELLQKMDDLKVEVASVLKTIDSPQLLERRTIQGFETTVLGALLHVTEHFSYHLGQISYVVKAEKNLDLGYYAGKDIE